MRKHPFRPHVEHLDARQLLSTVPIFSTGRDSSGGLASPGSNDPHFALVSAPPGVALQAVVFTSLPQGYVPNSTTSQWIGPSANPFDVQASGDYDYRTTFDLGGFDPATALVQVGLASDNDSKVSLNGVDTGIALMQPSIGAPDDYDAIHPFTIRSGFVAGLNTIDVFVHNDYSVTGLRMDLSGNATVDGVPTPVLTSASLNAGQTQISGTFQALPGQTFGVTFSTSTAVIGTSSVTTDAKGLGTILANLPTSVPTGTSIFARLSDSTGAVSALSNAVIVQGSADLGVSLSAVVDQFVTRHHIRLTTTVTNRGPAPASNVVLTVSPSDGSLYPAQPFPPGMVTSGPSATLAIPSLAAGVSEVLLADFYTGNAGPIVFDARVTSDTMDPNPADNMASLSVPLPISPVPTLDSAIVTSANTLVKGSISGNPNTAYHLDFYGGAFPDVPAHSDPPPFGVADVTTDAAGHAAFAVALPTTASAYLFLAATATGPNGTSNFSSVIAALISADLVVTIAPIPPGVVGQAIPVMATVSNRGPSTANEVLLTVDVPRGVEFGVEPVAAGILSFATESVSIQLAGLLAGQSASLTLLLRPSSAGPIAVTARSLAATPDPIPANNTASEVATITPPPPPAAVPGPVIVRLRREGIHRQTTRVSLTFNEALSSATAQDISNYRIIEAGADGKFGRKDDHLVGLRSATYNTGRDSVTLILKRRINLHQTYEVIASGAGPLGIRDLSGRTLNSSPDGTPGPPYRAIVRGFWTSAR